MTTLLCAWGLKEAETKGERTDAAETAATKVEDTMIDKE